MKIKMAIAASLLLVSVQTASAQYYYSNPYWSPYWNPNAHRYYYYQKNEDTAAENDLAKAKDRRDKARQEREETGASDYGARLRLEAECTRALERGVEDGVRRSYGCGDQSSYVPSVQQQPAGPKVVYPPSSARERTDQ
jgi:hypothetical protein